MSEAALRLFVAVELPQAVREAIGEQQDELRRHGLRLRWVRPEAVHLTLRFIGLVEPERLLAIEWALDEAIPPFEPFTLSASGLGVFGGDRARVLWLGLVGDIEALDRLRRAATAGLDSAGITSPNHDRFTPHLTLARVPDAASVDERRRLRSLAESIPAAPMRFEVRHVSLIRSELLRSGARYETLRRFPH